VRPERPRAPAGDPGPVALKPAEWLPARRIVASRREVRLEPPAVNDPFNLQRFVAAQAPVIDEVLAELRDGRKRSHWMWFVFPQLRGLGSSPTAVRYAICSLAEAKAYLEHPVLGPRLRDCTRLVLGVEDASIGDVFGYPDDRKFWSSMTLFSQASAKDPVFRDALRKYFGDAADPATLQHIRSAAGSGA
jgi:uncharacterized protein (DUF1810 family)